MTENIQAALRFLRHPGRPPAEQDDLARLSYLCGDWLRSRKYDLAVCAQAKKIGHAGLAYLAAEADWQDLLKRGKHEAREIVEQLLCSSATEDGLADTLEDYNL